jgi:hypothetical protein
MILTTNEKHALKSIDFSVDKMFSIHLEDKL